MNELKYIITDECPSDLPQIEEIRDWELFLKDCHVDYKFQYIVANDELKKFLTKKSSDLSLKDCPEIDIVCPQIDTTIRIQRIENEKLKKIVLFDDEGNGSMTSNYNTADTDYGPIGRGNVLSVDMPDKVSERIGMVRTIVTGIPLDLEAMKEVVAQTCTAAFYRRKGYVDSTEQSAVTFRELLKLFEVESGRFPRSIGNMVIELDDCFIYIRSDSSVKRVEINPSDFNYSSEKPLVLELVNQDVIDHWTREKEYIEQCEKIFERLTLSKPKCPILVFNWVDSITRGNHSFSASDILQKLGEGGFEKILQFQGVYTYRYTLKTERISLIFKEVKAGIHYGKI